MKRFALLLTFVIGSNFTSPAQSQHPAFPEDVKRIVFLGSIIIYAGTYIEYNNAYLTIRYPDRAFEIINVGLPSETVSGLSEPNHAGGALYLLTTEFTRLQRDILSWLSIF